MRAKSRVAQKDFFLAFLRASAATIKNWAAMPWRQLSEQPDFSKKGLTEAVCKVRLSHPDPSKTTASVSHPAAFCSACGTRSAMSVDESSRVEKRQ